MNAPASELPVVVIGAGPVGLAAAAHLRERGLTSLVLEAGPTVGAAVRRWGHTRLFSPWRYNIDDAARRLLEPTGWQAHYESGRWKEVEAKKAAARKKTAAKTTTKKSTAKKAPKRTKKEA